MLPHKFRCDGPESRSELKLATASPMPQNAMRLCFSIPYTIPPLVVLAELKTTDSRRICITVPEGWAYCSPIHRRINVCPRKNNATSIGRETIKAARVPWITSRRKLSWLPSRFKGAGQRRERRGHRRDDLARVTDQESANRVKRDRSRGQKSANHQIVGVVGHLHGHVNQKRIKAVIPKLAAEWRDRAGRKTTLSCG